MTPKLKSPTNNSLNKLMTPKLKFPTNKSLKQLMKSKYTLLSMLLLVSGVTAFLVVYFLL